MSTDTGRQAEDAAAEYLSSKKFEILSQNWRTRWCEIDIVAKKKKIIYFVEVKYRKTADFGGGLDYITHAKLKQMKFAAEFWISNNNWSGDYRISAIEVSGSSFEITEFLENL
jgi:uncharacterized protein (TIGR00252 family)